MDIIIRMLPPKAQIAFDYIAKLIEMLVGCALAYAGYLLATKMLAGHESTEALGIPIWPFRFIWVLGGVLIAAFSIWNMFGIPAKHREVTLSAQDAEIAEAMHDAAQLYGVPSEEGGDEK